MPLLQRLTTALRPSRPSVVATVTFALGLLFGPGFLWQREQSAAATRSADAEVARLGLESREQLNTLLVELIHLGSTYADVRDCDPASAAYVVTNKLVELEQRIRVRETDISAIEAHLARIENRQPRSIRVDWVPPSPPTILSIEVTTPEGVQVEGFTVDTAGTPRPACPALK